MKMDSPKFAILALGLSALAAVACSADGGNPFGGNEGGGGSGGTSEDGGPDLGDDGTPPDGTDFLPETPDEKPKTGEVYAHSKDTLYKLDPISKEVTVIGPFGCQISWGMLDIAVDKNDRIIGSIQGALLEIDKDTAQCWKLADTSTTMNSLTFVPAGTLDPVEEVLVGYERDQYIRFDMVTGKTTLVGYLNSANSGGVSWVSSGDIVSIVNGGTYLTVHPSDNSSKDSIVEVDPKTGKVLKVIGNTGFASLFGLGYWGGIAYGFGDDGKLSEIDLTTGKGVEIPLPSMPAGLSFWGAGVTTVAPTEIIY